MRSRNARQDGIGAVWGTGGWYLEFAGHDELRRVNANQRVHAAEQQDGQDDGKVADELPDLGGKIYFYICF